MFVKQMPITIRKRTGKTDPSLALRMTRGVESVGRGFPDGPWCCAGCGARRLGAPNHVSAHCFLLCERTGETFKDHFASLLEKETGFGIQRKRGSRVGQVAPNSDPAARLYAPIVDQPRLRQTTPAEQGQAVVLSQLFSPPARVGIGTWWRCLVLPLLRRGMVLIAVWAGVAACGAVPSIFPIHASLFSFPFLCGARPPRRAPGAALVVGRDDSARHGTALRSRHSEAKPKNPFSRPLRDGGDGSFAGAQDDAGVCRTTRG